MGMLYIVLGLLGVVFLVAGIVCLVLYARKRSKALLVVGLLLSLVVPGLAFCCLLALLARWIPDPFVVYAPPPPTIAP
jgi:Mn2+/Fe2+ NRAMP family transporter